jgi:5-hydroxyisourate hydrolase-like protein (transthyretin family)
VSKFVIAPSGAIEHVAGAGGIAAKVDNADSGGSASHVNDLLIEAVHYLFCGGEPEAHYHMPLVVSCWSYPTCRGS